MEIQVKKPENQTTPATAEKLAEPPKEKVTGETVPKRGRGRPRKNPDEVSTKSVSVESKRGPGRPPSTPKPPTIKPPDFAEWNDFIGSVVIRWASRAFIAVVFRGLDYQRLLTPEELEDLELDDEQLQDLAKPFAHVAIKSKFLTKHGRMIVDSKDAIDAAIVMFMWSARVRRIAKKYRPEKPKRVRKVIRNAQPSGENVPEEPEPASQNGRVVVGNPAIGQGFN